MQPKLRSVRAGNASAMTGTGTNSYILGQGGVVVIDPGPDDPDHLAAIMAALDPGETVEAILVTHAHLDHSALVPRLQSHTRAATFAFGGATDGRSPRMTDLVAHGLTGGGEGLDTRFQPDHRLRDGERLTWGTVSVEVIHTPGHMGGHLCFACGDTLFSGDHVMGWATSLVSPPDGDMAAYMASLRRLAGRDWQQMLPGHGQAVKDPAARLAFLIAHRHHREAEITAELDKSPGTAAELAARIYRDIPPALMPAAARNVLAHLIDLSDRNLAQAPDRISQTSRFARS